MSIFRLARLLVSTSFLCGLFVASSAVGQTISSLTPSSVAAGSGGFLLTVYGSGFESGSLVQIHTTNAVVSLQTYFVNTGLLMAAVTSIESSTSGTLQVDVANYSTHSSSNLVALKVTGSGTSSGSGSGTGSGSGSGSGTGSGSGSGSGTGSGSGSGGITSPSGSPLLVRVTSPLANESVRGAVTIASTAKQTSVTDGSISSWAIFDRSKLLWVDLNPDPSISVKLALSAGAHLLRVVAYDDSFAGSTATVPVTASISGETTSWNACIYTHDGEKYQAMRISPGQTLTGVLQSQMFYGSNCNPTQWTDQMNDVGRSMTFGAGSSWLYWFIHRPDMPDVSAVWTMGDQTSGCVNYSTAPPCD